MENCEWIDIFLNIIKESGKNQAVFKVEHHKQPLSSLRQPMLTGIQDAFIYIVTSVSSHIDCAEGGQPALHV